jgi:2-iminoacetate synthase ThiH
MGSTMIEENVVSSAGTTYRMDEPQIAAAILDAGFTPMRRNMKYERLGPPSNLAAAAPQGTGPAGVVQIRA